ncbi:MAG: hypothetical protein IPK82_14160 [Polyangiaceae bacterium]|nr:hypothetical protein [Polyangiaceae bacterium]
MVLDDLAARVIAAVKNKPEAVKAISDALASGDAKKIRDALSTHAGISLSDDEAQEVASQMLANPQQPAAYYT